MNTSASAYCTFELSWAIEIVKQEAIVKVTGLSPSDLAAAVWEGFLEGEMSGVNQGRVEISLIHTWRTELSQETWC